MRLLTALGLIAGTALPAAAEVVPPRDASCKPTVTVRHQDCSAITYYLCAAETGVLLRSEVFHQGEASMVGIYDADYNLLAAEVARGLARITAGDAAGDIPLSLQDLRDKGRAHYVETLIVNTGGLPVTITNDNEVQLRPEPVQIGGQEFFVAEIATSATVEPGLGKMTSTVRIFLNDGIGHPVEGRTSNTVNGITTVSASDPVEISLPGEPGFESPQPRPGCGPAQDPAE